MKKRIGTVKVTPKGGKPYVARVPFLEYDGGRELIPDILAILAASGPCSVEIIAYPKGWVSASRTRSF